jgi:hypothetical protein
MDNHIIITNFNKRLEGKDINNLYKGNPSWMKKRIKLFEKYYIPSFNNQTDKNHHNFIMCDEETPTEYKNQLLDFSQQYPFLTFFFTKNSVINSIDLIKSTYLDKRKNNINELYISRVDNDDFVSSYYNQTVKHYLKYYEWITLTNGICLNYFDHNSITYFPFPRGPFVSRKTTIDNFQTPYGMTHWDVPSTSIETNHPMWGWVIHEDNLHNTMKGTPIQIEKNQLKELYNI